MYKKTIKDQLKKTFLSEESVPGLSVTNSALKKSKAINKQGVKDIEKNISDFEKNVRPDANAKEMAPNKFNYDHEEEKTLHDEIEIMNGQEMVQYASDPDKRFKERALEAIEGSSNMGNNPEWANVIPKQQGFTGPEFGKNLAKNIKASAQKRLDAQKGLYSFGDDIENDTRKNLKNTRFSALSENKNNKKTEIKESMKRLNFKNPFNGVGNALKLIPEGYKVNNKVFEMTDGNESYKIRWEGSLSEGKAVVLTAADKSLVNEDITRMKQLYGYKSHETLGTLKGKERIDENKIFSDIWGKTKMLLETEDMEGADAKEGNWDEETKKAPEATKHVKASVKKDAGIAKGKEGNPDKAVKHAPEAKTPMKSSKGVNIETDADAAEGYWEDAAKAQAPEAKKHIHLKEAEEMEEDYMDETEMEEGSLVDEGYMDEEMMIEMLLAQGIVAEEEEEEEAEEEEDSWEKSDDEEETETEPMAADIKTDISIDSEEDDDDDDIVVPSPANFRLLFSQTSGEYWIDNNGVKSKVPTKYYSIASDKSKKGSEKAAKISALMDRDAENGVDVD
jgi:hypothetical protein